ncbi:MAG: Lrp/AsnC ligand binding domain-containing protein, partial [Candidatus Jordarchaeaceae archaeon]
MSKNGDSKKSDKNTNEKESFVAFVLLKIEGKLDEVLKGLKQIKEVKETYLLFGEYDAIVKIEVKNVSDIETISKKILECIGPVKVVLTLHTHPLPPFVYGDTEGRL